MPAGRSAPTGSRESNETREPYDGVQFVDGLIAPGESATVSVVVTDTTPRWEFFLLQTQDSPLAGRQPVDVPLPGGRRPRPLALQLTPTSGAAAPSWPAAADVGPSLPAPEHGSDRSTIAGGLVSLSPAGASSALVA